MKIAVIGTGISGNSAAWALSKSHDVTLYEKRDRLGGHTATEVVDYDGVKITVDTGFIVYNLNNYPNLTALFEHLGVETRETYMTFSVSMDDGNLEWQGYKFKGIFAQRRNLFRPSFLHMLSDILRFNRRAKRDLKSGALCGLTLDDYLRKGKFSKRMAQDYLVPMTSAIWSTPTTKMLEFPAESLIQFMNNHNLIQHQRPVWRTVCNGSKTYVDKLHADMDVTLRTNHEVTGVEPTSNGVLVKDSSGNETLFDQVVMATHSDQALRILTKPTKQQHAVLSRIKYTKNDVWLHRDPKLMPKRQDAWASWNYAGHSNDTSERDVSVTYWMNSLQGIDEKYNIFVSLNPLKEPDPELTFKRTTFSHPLFDKDAVEAQGELDEIQGDKGIWFCGAWTGFGFHEDGLRSGLDVAERLGGVIPWREKTLADNQHEEVVAAKLPLTINDQTTPSPSSHAVQP